MTQISTLHAASLLRRDAMKLDSHGAMGTLGNLKFAAQGGTGPSRRAGFLDKVRIRLGALKDVLLSSSERRAQIRLEGESLRAAKRCGHLFGKLTADMGNSANIASADKTLQRMMANTTASSVNGKWRETLEKALARVNDKDLEAMRTGLLELDESYTRSAQAPSDETRAMIGLLKEMLFPGEVAHPKTETPVTIVTARPSAFGPISEPQTSAASHVENVAQDQARAMSPPPPPPPPPPAAKSPAAKPGVSAEPDQAGVQRSFSDELNEAVSNQRLRKAAPSPNQAQTHADALLDAIRNPKLKPHGQTDEAVKKAIERDKAKVDAAKNKALTPEQKKLGGVHQGLMDEIQGARGLSPSQLKGRSKAGGVPPGDTSATSEASGIQAFKPNAPDEAAGAA